MPSATKSSPCVRRSKPRNTPTHRRSPVYKALGRGLAIMTIGCVTLASVTTAAGWLLATFVQARSDMRTALVPVPPSGQGTRTGPIVAALAARSPVAAISPSAGALDAFKASVINPMGALALVIPAASARPDPADPDHTGSIGASYKVAALEFSPAHRPDVPPRASSDPMPLPRARPRLAALTPTGESAIQLEQSARPPRTAIYDITAKTVYLPGGQRLEAHSGLGELMDDPRYVNRKNRGATPPNTYRLKMREALFHGVQAIRLTPVGDSEMYNRDGILAHSYLLGPSGQSNGCVSFKDYSKFLQAFLRGEIDHIVVVSRLAGAPTQSAYAVPSEARQHRIR